MPGEFFDMDKDERREFDRAMRAFNQAEEDGFDFDAFPGDKPSTPQQSDEDISAFKPQKVSTGFEEFEERMAAAKDRASDDVRDVQIGADGQVDTQGTGLTSDEKADLLLHLVASIDDKLPDMRNL